MHIADHLIQRHLDIELHRPIIDEVERVATFYLWNLSGQLVGYQQYRPGADKVAANDPKNGRYYTYRRRESFAIWGAESLRFTPRIVFITEGIFDACRLTKNGVSAVAVLSNDPGPNLKNWIMALGRIAVVVYDNDRAGRFLAKYSRYNHCMNEKDLGDSSEEEIQNLINNYRTFL